MGQRTNNVKFLLRQRGDKRRDRVGQACVKKYQGERIMIFGYIDYVITGDSFTKSFAG